MDTVDRRRLLRTLTGLSAVFLIAASRSLATPDPKTAILSAVSAGSKLTVRDIPSVIILDRASRTEAQDALKSLLRTEPTVGIEWSNAIDALGVLGGYSADSGSQTLANLQEFALSSRCYACTKDDGDLPGTPLISQAGAAAKSEVPFAIVNFARAAQEAGNLVFVHKATEALREQTNPEYWAHVQWTTATVSIDGGPAMKNRLAAVAQKEKMRLFASLGELHHN